MENRAEDRDACGAPSGAEGPAGSAGQLTFTVESLVRRVRHSATAGGLSTTASSAPARLALEGPLRLTGPARAEGVSRPGMTRLASRLERAGPVARGADRADGRGVLVEITGTGLEVFRQRRTERAHAPARSCSRS